MKSILLKLHLSVLLAGFTGVFGRLISVHQFSLTFLRLLLASMMIWGMLLVGRKVMRIPARSAVAMLGVGALLGLHWLFFYWSIKESNVSVGVVCYSLVGFFSAVMEPLLGRRRISWRDLSLSLLTLLGVGLIFGVDTKFRTGILLGCVSSFLASLFTICNRKVGESCEDTPSSLILGWEMTGGLLTMALLLPYYLNSVPLQAMAPGAMDLVWLILLASACTLGLQFLQIQVLRRISAFTVNLTYNLEPVYSILLAFLIFDEGSEISLAFYAGIVLIMVSVGLQSWFSSRESKTPAPAVSPSPRSSSV